MTATTAKLSPTQLSALTTLAPGSTPAGRGTKATLARLRLLKLIAPSGPAAGSWELTEAGTAALAAMTAASSSQPPTPAAADVAADVVPLPKRKARTTSSSRSTSSRKSGNPPADREQAARRQPRTGGTAGLAVHAGPHAHIDRATGYILAIRPAAYPELIEGELRCLGACGELRPAARFPFIASKGDGRGRFVECTACQAARLAENKTRKAAGKAPIARPLAEVAAPAEAPAAAALGG